jgi:hypothetical protein
MEWTSIGAKLVNARASPRKTFPPAVPGQAHRRRPVSCAHYLAGGYLCDSGLLPVSIKIHLLVYVVLGASRGAAAASEVSHSLWHSLGLEVAAP